jgi:dipeptidyl aminopeptidase/acylaminoacyl peptidase
LKHANESGSLSETRADRDAKQMIESNILRGFSALLLALTLSFASLSPVLAQTPPPIDAYGELPTIEDVAISPSGRNIALVTSVDGQRVVAIMGADRKLRNAIPIKDLKVRSIRFIDDQGLLLVRSFTAELGRQFAQNKIELSQGVVLPVEDPEMQGVIFEQQKGIENALRGSYGIRNSGGAMKGYFGGITLELHKRTGDYVFEHGRPELYEVDLKTLRSKRVAKAGSGRQIRDWVVDPQGQVAVSYTLWRESGNWSLSNAAGQKIVEDTNIDGRVGLLGLSEDGSSALYYARDPETQLTDWFSVPLDGSAPPTEFLADVDVDRLYWDRETGLLLGYLPGAGDQKVVFFDPAKQRAADAVRTAFEGFDTRLVEWTSDFTKFIVRSRGNQNSGIWFYVDMTTGAATVIGRERPDIGAEDVGPISTFEYKAQDGLELDGILTLPPGREAKNLPLVMLPHGGPQSHSTETFNWWAQAVASRGYAVFQPNFRGSTNRDDAFVQAGKGEWGQKMQTDVSDGLAALADAGIVDPDRACIMGASYGGYAALAGVTLQNGLYKCAVAVAPVTDLSRTFKTEMRESGGSRLVRRSRLEQFGPKADFKAISPYRHADRADAPILLIHGLDDTVVPYNQSRIMANALKGAGKPHRLVKLREEDHWLSLASTRKQMLREAIAFIEEHNPAD